MAYTIHKIDQGWAGDCKRHLVVVTLGATNDQVYPKDFGLYTIQSVRPTGRTGTVQGQSSVVTATVTDLACGSTGTYQLNAAAAKVELEFVGK